jgi:esterase/lipase superfamily enzyme
MTRRTFQTFLTLLSVFAWVAVPSARAQLFNQQTDPKPILYALIQAFQNCGPPQAYQILGVQLFQTIATQTGGIGCYAALQSAGPVTGMETTGVQNFLDGPVFSVRVSHQGGTKADWFIGLSNLSGKVEYLNFQAAQSTTPVTPQSLPQHQSADGGNIPNPTPSGSTSPNQPPTQGCKMFPSMCSDISGDPTTAPSSTTEADKADYLVWYGTNRRPNQPGDPSTGYSAARDTVVHHGSCRVFIPKSHKIGSIGSPWWKRLLSLSDDRLRLLAINEFEQSAYWDSVTAHLAAVATEERNALIFVHGYNVAFEDAALRAAQIGFDLSVKGAMAFFSWPSQGVTSGYPADEATIEASEGVIADFMTDFAEKSGAGAVHIIAHSMGNRGVLRAVNRIAAQAQRRTGKPFGQIILAAADVDVDVFRQLSAAYAQVASRTTLYVSKRDLAVEASRWLHNFPRAGLMPPTLVLPGIDTVNVTDVDLTMLGHGYVADARAVLTDMYTLITRDTPPGQRFGLRPATNEQGKRFWLIGG